MIIIRFFSSCDIRLGNIFEQFDLFKDNQYNIDYRFTNDNNYTHAILINNIMPKLKNIPKENVLGLSSVPLKFLGITNEFLEYTKKYVGTYILLEKMNPLTKPFILESTYLPNPTIYDYYNNEKKTEIMSIVISNKKLKGNKYKHKLVKKILEKNLPIDIYGEGCCFYDKNKKQIKGPFKSYSNKPYINYLFHISIESISNDYYIGEEIKNALLCNTTPIYLGCKNINDYIPNNYISLTENIEDDIELIENICDNPNKYVKKINIEEIKEIFSFKKIINKFINNNLCNHSM